MDPTVIPDDGAVIPSIATFSHEPEPLKDMGFFALGYKKLENWEERKKEVEQAIEEIAPTPPEKEKDEDLECELQLSPMDVDKALVSGIELELTTGSFFFGNFEGGVFISRHFRQWL